MIHRVSFIPPRYTKQTFTAQKETTLKTRPVQPTSAVNDSVLNQILTGGYFSVDGAGYSIYLRSASENKAPWLNGPYIVIEETLNEQAYWNAGEGWTDPCITIRNFNGPGSIGYQPNETNPYLIEREGQIYTDLVLRHLEEIQADQKRRKILRN